MIQIAEALSPNPTPLWRLVQQAGVRYVVGRLDHEGGGGALWRERQRAPTTLRAVPPGAVPRGGEAPWDYMPLVRLKKQYEDGGFEFSVIEDSPPMERIRLGLPGRDEEIEAFRTLLRNMGALGIPVLCYNFMAQINWLRTSVTTPGRGGAWVTGYDHEVMRNAPLTEAGIVPEERLWENFEYFLRCVLPVAEEVGVRLALHPDDPPLSPIRGIGRIMRTLDAFQRVIEMAPSPSNGLTFCQGNFTLMTDDLPAAIRHFGRQDKIFFVHFRDVRGTPERFVETFHDEGQTDMLACMRAYREIGFEGVLRPDHVPTLEGDQNDSPGYASIGRLFAIGYIRGLQQAVYA